MVPHHRDQSGTSLAGGLCLVGGSFLNLGAVSIKPGKISLFDGILRE